MGFAGLGTIAKISRKLGTAGVDMSARRQARIQGVELGHGVRFLGRPQLDVWPGSVIQIGEGATLISRSRSNAIGLSGPVRIRTLDSAAIVVIGKDSGLSGTIITCAMDVSIGSGCLIGADVLIIDTDLHPVRPLNRRHQGRPPGEPHHRIALGDNVFVGARSIILKGVKLGENCVVGAGSVVTRSFSANSLVAGNPAQQISKIQP